MALQTDVAMQSQAHELIMFDWKNRENTHTQHKWGKHAVQNHGAQLQVQDADPLQYQQVVLSQVFFCFMKMIW